MATRASLSKFASPIEHVLGETGRFEAVDTSFLYEELRRQYQGRGEHVEVDFRQLVSWLRIGDQLTHHIHPYPAKLLPHIAHFFIRASTLHRGKKSVLDPFCGSGTVALEASLAGCQPYVADANPFALLLTKVKTTPYDTVALRASGRALIQRASRYKTAQQVSIVNDHLWYLPEQKKALEILLRAVNGVEDSDERDFFQICFSAVARKVSFADPAVSVPVRLRTKDRLTEAANEKVRTRLKWIKDVSPLDELQRTIEANIRRVEEANTSYPERVQAQQVGIDARNLIQPGYKVKSMAENSLPLIVTSPPYGSAQKYVRASCLSLNWLSLASPDQLSEYEGKSIGREHISKFNEPDADEPVLPKRYEQLIEKVSATNELRGRITKRYLCEMNEVVSEVSRVCAPGGRAVFVIGNNQVCGEALRNDEYLIDCFKSNGMNLELGLLDHIKSRGLMTKRNRTASVISREAVLVFKKGE
jgi:tRNA G10  N-methylase Trm11